MCVVNTIEKEVILWTGMTSFFMGSGMWAVDWIVGCFCGCLLDMLGVYLNLIKDVASVRYRAKSVAAIIDLQTLIDL